MIRRSDTCADCGHRSDSLVKTVTDQLIASTLCMACLANRRLAGRHVVVTSPPPRTWA